MLRSLTEIFALSPEQRGPVIAALVGAMAALITSVISIFVIWNGARTTAKATKEAAEIAAVVKRESETLSRLLVPLVTPSMIDAMKSLWVKTSTFAASQTPPVDLESRTNFVRDLTMWYYSDANGLFLSSETRDALFRVRCCALRPDEAKAAGFDLNYELSGPNPFPQSDDELSKSLREQVSELRSALKRQLGIYGAWNDRGQVAEGSKRNCQPAPRRAPAAGG